MKAMKAAAAFAASFLCAFLSVLNVCATVTTWSVDFNGVQQAKSNWCWAASAEASAHHAYPNSTRSQYQAVYLIYGPEYPNLGANIEQTASAATYLAHNYVTYQGYYSMPISEFLTYQLTVDKVTILAFGYYTTSGTRTGGHAVTVQGISLDSDTGRRTIHLYEPTNDEIIDFDLTDMYNGDVMVYTSGGVRYLQFDQSCYY